jgi:hypothetical protein
MKGQNNPNISLSWADNWQSTCNRLGFALRNFLNTTPGAYQEIAALNLHVFSQGTEAHTIEKHLLSRYNLTQLRDTASQSRYQETLTYLHWLDTLHATNPNTFATLIHSQQAPLRWLDVGAKNWAYVGALSAFLEACTPLAPTKPASIEPIDPVDLANKAPREALSSKKTAGGAFSFQLDGVELDPHRRYADFQTRGQYAQAHIRTIPQAAYHAANILDWRQPAHIVSHFLPFVFREPHLAWGLPIDYFQPQAILNHLLSLLSPGGVLILINQGEVEAEAQATLLHGAAQTHAIRYESVGQLPAPFIEYRYPRYGWLVIKSGF